MSEPTEPGYPFGVEYEAPSDYELPKDLSLGSVPGLLEIRVFTMSSAAAGTRLLSMWESEVAYKTRGGTFESKIGLKRSSWRGFRRTALHAPTKPWYKDGKVLWWAIVHAVAVLGTLEALRNHYQSLHVLFLGKPTLAIEMIGEPPRVLVGSTGKLAVMVRNKSLKAPVDVDLDPDSTFLDHGGLKAEIAHSWGPQFPFRLEPGERREIQASYTPENPGSLRYQLKLTSSSGLLRPKRLTQMQVAVQTWASLALGDKQEVTDHGPTCQVSYQVHVGKEHPMGIRTTASLSRVPGAVIRYMTVDGDECSAEEIPRPTTTRGEELTWARVKTGPIGSFRTLGGYVVVEKTGASPPACEEIAEKLTLEARRGGCDE